jgi:nitrite reductase (NO-forming)
LARNGRSLVTYRPDVTFTLRTDIAEGELVFIGETGAIAGKINPDLKVPTGAVVQINLVNGDGAIHDVAIPEFGAKSDSITAKGAATAMVFRATRAGDFEYLCTLPGHKAAGMFGRLIVASQGNR